MIYFKLNKKLDYFTYETFRNLRYAGLDFGEEIRSSYPELSISNYKKYIDEYYKNHKAEMLDVKNPLNEKMSQKTVKFFLATRRLFGKDYSKQNYTGYLSMFYCNPRFLDDNSFQIYYKHTEKELMQTVFHEVLHFIFFDYCKNNVSETKKLDCNSGPLWELSEIFDVLILNSNDFQQILPEKNELCYSDLSEKYKIIEKIWRENLPIKTFITRSLKKFSE